MAQTPQSLTAAPNGTIWSGKSGDTTFFLRKINGKYEVWNSKASSAKYPVTVEQAVTYTNQYSMKATNLPPSAKTPAQSSPKPQPIPQPKPLAGPASDNSGQKQPNTAGSTGGPPSKPTGTDSQSQALQPVTSTSEQPGRRLKNPLGYLSSYTYQISLYMITPDAYTAFVNTGRRNINIFNQATQGTGAGGAFLIAQSAGVNNKTQTRAPGFDLDYYIDNLSITSQASGRDPGGSGTATNVSEMSFQIIEPYGFTFLSKLSRAAEEIQKYSGSLAKDNYPENPSKQFFILGIRFFGYDDNGQPVEGSRTFDGRPIDPNASGTALFERYYDVMLTSIKFKLDGRMTVYNITANQSAQMAAFGKKYGQIIKDTPLTATTVGDALTKLMASLNEEEEKAATERQSKVGGIVYKIAYAPGAEEIAAAQLVSEAELDKARWPGSGATTSSQVNDKTVVENQRPKENARTIQIKGQQSILQGINDIIVQSKFLEDALTAVKTDALEPDPSTKQTTEVKPDTKKKIKWYNCTANIDKAIWDSTKNDWTYHITYFISTYETPIISTSGTNPGVRYYGPHKRYEYWYTGENSEIISYAQELNNAYYNILADGTVKPTATDGGSNPATSTSQSGSGTNKDSPASTPTITNQRNDQPRLGRLGLGLDAQNNYISSLYDPAAQASATINILGDPDYLMANPPTNESQVYNKYYGTDGFTVNPNGGQVFLEIDFKEAVDYVSQKTSFVGSDNKGIVGEAGTLSINDSILFWKYPQDVSRLVQGISYQLVNVKSTLNQGSFKQTLGCIINTFANVNAPTDGSARESTAGGQNNGNGSSTPGQSSNTPGAPQGGGTASGPTQKVDQTVSFSGASDAAAAAAAAATQAAGADDNRAGPVVTNRTSTPGNDRGR